MPNPTHTEIGRVFVSQHRDSTIYTRGQWHIYDNGVWLPVNDLCIDQQLWNLLEKYEQSHQVRPSLSIQKSINKYTQANLFIPEDKMDSYPNLTNVTNGVYNLEDGNLYPHQTNYYMTAQLPFSYDPNATADQWQQYMESSFVLPQSTTPDTELIAFVQEATGYSLTADISYHTTFWCYGEGSNGKGVLFAILEALAGTTAIPLNVNLLRREQYQLANLAGKRVALCTEANSNDNLVEDALIKALVAGDAMQVRMIRREPFTLYPQVKLWWSMNRLPAVADTSHGFWRRVKVIPFNRRFTESERDINLKEKLLQELPGIFNWAVEGLQRLQKQGHFTEPKQVISATEQYKRESNVTQLFVDERCDVVTGGRASSTAVYEDYKIWTFQNNYRPHSSRSLKRELEALGYFSRHGSSGNYYEGIELKP